MYDLIIFRIASVGTDEIRLTSTGKQPFTLDVVVRDNQGAFTIDEHLSGAPVAAVKKYVDAIIALRHTGELRIYDLEDERQIFHASNIDSRMIPGFDPGLLKLVNDACIVSNEYKTPITMPEVITREDAETIAFLKSLLDGGMPGIKAVTCTIIKDETEAQWINGVVQGTGDAGTALRHEGMTRYFAGTPIRTT